MLTELRAEYWIVRGRNFVKKLIRSCNICKRFHGRPYTYSEIPDLPVESVFVVRPFLAVGVDHCGLLYIKDIYENSDEEHMNKCYIVLYTCAAFSGSHIRDGS